jgi:SAM-dependent methyltransferase
MTQTLWDLVSTQYQQNHHLPTHTVSYGPWSPDESQLNLLGNVAQQSVLDLGCGGGQNCIALAQQGASVIGIDISNAQLTYARVLAEDNKSNVEFLHGGFDILTQLAENSFDLILSVYVLPYLDQVALYLHECYRLLQRGGRMIFSFDHPFRDSFVDLEEQELVLYPQREYLADCAMDWLFAESNTVIPSLHLPISGWLELISVSGLRLVKLLEPPVPSDIVDNLWPIDDALAPLRNLPHTIIFVAEKP